MERWRQQVSPRCWIARTPSAPAPSAAFAGWEMLAVEPADTAGLGWPMNKTAPQWYRLHRRT